MVSLHTMRHLFFLSLLVFSITAFSQDMKKFSLYKPEEKAETEIANDSKLEPIIVLCIERDQKI